jgi:hypothetical protein
MALGDLIGGYCSKNFGAEETVFSGLNHVATGYIFAERGDQPKYNRRQHPYASANTARGTPPDGLIRAGDTMQR